MGGGGTPFPLSTVQALLTPIREKGGGKSNLVQYAKRRWMKLHCFMMEIYKTSMQTLEHSDSTESCKRVRALTVCSGDYDKRSIVFQ